MIANTSCRRISKVIAKITIVTGCRVSAVYAVSKRIRTSLTASSDISWWVLIIQIKTIVTFGTDVRITTFCTVISRYRAELADLLSWTYRLQIISGYTIYTIRAISAVSKGTPYYCLSTIQLAIKQRSTLIVPFSQIRCRNSKGNLIVIRQTLTSISSWVQIGICIIFT